MIYNRLCDDKDLRIYAYKLDGLWYVDFERRGDVHKVALPLYIKHWRGVCLWVKRWVLKNAPLEKVYLFRVYNYFGDDIGLKISIYEQGCQWIADITTNKMAHWIEIPLHYSIRTFAQAVEWALNYADGERMIFIY